VPATHDVIVEDVNVEGQEKPGGHGVHCVEPTSAKVPDAHISISVPSAFEHAVPAGHTVHVALPPRA
jgi:hypothetical protein|tara:strand:+ start:8442 stop:8642 length:201 start_codon:yes stop_codon:yes gene_type:complete